MFDQLTGNERVKQLLRRMLELGRVPRALLFTGEEGIGKKLFALELARLSTVFRHRVLKHAASVLSAFGSLTSTFPSLRESDDWKKIIWTDHATWGWLLLLNDSCSGQMRQIEREVTFARLRVRQEFSRRRCGQLNESSSNALLKVLEEPPRTTHIILITSPQPCYYRRYARAVRASGFRR